MLCDAERRAQYDRFGHAAFEQGAGFGGFDFSAAGFEDIFGDIFGDFFGSPRRGRSRSRRGEDLRYDLEISFEEAVFGAEKTIRVPRLVACERLPRQRLEERRAARDLHDLPRQRPAALPAGTVQHRQDVRPLPGAGHRPARSVPHLRRRRRRAQPADAQRTHPGRRRYRLAAEAAR